jgi:ATP-dependent DNA helicase RecG
MEDSFIIKNLLEQPEGERLEFKSKLDLEPIARVITSFVNTSGGDLVVGINDDGSLASIQIDEYDKIKVTDYLVQSIKPTVPISVQLLPYKGKRLLLISVWEGSNKPYSFNKEIYFRQKSLTRVGSSRLNSRLLNEQVYSEQRWERQAVLGASVSDLDSDEIDKAIHSFKKYSQSEDSLDTFGFLVQKGLIVNGNITNACMLLFGTNPTRFLPQARIKLVVYPGLSSGDVFMDNLVYEGNIFKNFEKILSRLDSVLGKDILIKGAFRTENNRYPEMALREGLMNAIVHRDYSSTKSFLTIQVFSDRLVVSNYGGLPKELSVKLLKKEHNSILRNPDIAQMCFYRNLIEMLGTGTQRMIRDCKMQGFKSPVWKDSNNILTVTYPEVSHRYEGVNEGVYLTDEGVNKGVKLNINEPNESIRFEVEQLYKQIEKYPGKKASELNEQIGKSLSTTERYLKILRDHGYIEFQGAPKTGGYFIAK